MPQYSFLPELILRTPKNAFSGDISLEYVLEQMKDAAFQEAIYIASPSLYLSLLDFVEGKISSEKHRNNVIQSCTKYILRSRSRATPFGLFSTIGMVQWGVKDEVQLTDKIDRKTRLDFSFLVKIIEQLNNHEGLRNRIKYYPNTTLYRLKENLRYVEVSEENERSSHQISSIVSNEYIEKVLHESATGKSKNELLKGLTSEGIGEQDANNFIGGLIECQLLVSDLRVSLTGIDNLLLIISYLEENADLDGIQGLLDLLRNTSEGLKNLDNSSSNSIQNYLNISSQFQLETERMFGVDSFSNFTPDSQINNRWQVELLEALEFLNNFQTETILPDLENFKEQFKRRFEGEEVGLLSALEALGYGQSLEMVDLPLIEGVNFNSPLFTKTELELKPNFKILNDLLNKAIEKDEHEIILDNVDFEQNPTPLNFSPSTSVIFRMISSDKIFFEGLGGSSAKSLLNRFSYASEDIASYLYKIREIEQSNNPEILQAEIVHLPDNKFANVLIRNANSQYEIPILSKGGLAHNRQILLNDLLVFVSDNKIFLKSKSLGKIIVPKLSTAHNYDERSLYIYKFLCDLQFQEVDRSLTFQWGKSLEGYTFLPRISFKNVVLHFATWILDDTDIKNLIAKNGFEKYRKLLNLPNKFTISEGDNELYIDTENSLLLELFKNSIKTKNSVLLKEFLLDDSLPIKDMSKEHYSNQFIAGLVRSDNAYAIGEHVKSKIKTPLIEVCSIPNEHWVFIKLYCKAGKVDLILQECIAVILNEGFKNGLIDLWFFLRYQDPDYHLRVRFHLKEQTCMGPFNQLLMNNIKKFEDEGIVWKTIAEKYEPEIERYNVLEMINAEHLFFLDSKRYMNLLENLEESNLEEQKWLFVIRLIDISLESFGLSLHQKHSLLENLKDAFSLEFGVDQLSKRQLDKKYRTFRSDIESVLMGENNLFEEILNVENITYDFDLNNEQTITALKGLVHMSVNRYMTSLPRLHELLIYDFLFRYYTSEIARNKS
jgi:thiopeptide-type bacteriocin biosynthesis protein